MKRVLVFIKDKLAFVLAVTAAAIVGGATTAVVMAAIPDTAGMIHGCYQTTLGTVRIIDSSTASCGIGETSLNWSQTGSVKAAYAELNSDGSALDTSFSKNITSFAVVPISGGDTVSLCFNVNFDPRMMVAEMNGAPMQMEHGTQYDSGNVVNYFCGTGYNAVVIGLNMADYNNDFSNFRFMFYN